MAPEIPAVDTQVPHYEALLRELDELNKQQIEHIKGLAIREAIVRETRMLWQAGEHNNTDILTLGDRVEDMEESLATHREMVRTHLKNIKKMTSAYHELILGFLGRADTQWLSRQRNTLLAAFTVSQEVHTLIMKRNEDTTHV